MFVDARTVVCIRRITFGSEFISFGVGDTRFVIVDSSFVIWGIGFRIGAHKSWEAGTILRG